MKPRSITEADLRRLALAGACYLPEVGELVADLPLEDLEWAATGIPDLPERDRRLLHRLTGIRSWWVNDKRHRTDGPAIEHADGYREWWLNGQLHRTDGPAIEDADGSRSWYLNGQLHRTDGPAIEDADGDREWWIDGKRMTEAEHKRRTK
jgi:hypothetical protein